MNSAIYIGPVIHHRLKPVEHRFVYQINMVCVDLDELPELFNKSIGFGPQWWQPLRFKRSDYLGEGDLKKAIAKKIKQLTGETISGRVMLLCQLRYFGLYFSPVNFYYLYDENDHWRYLLAEVSNTPWNEKYYYAIPAEKTWQHQKAFHVSPFNPIEQHYHWQLSPLGQRAKLHINVHREDKEFQAGINLEHHPFSSKLLWQLMIKMPLMPVKILTGIYSHAFRLWRKSAPFYSHPTQPDHLPTRSQHVNEQ